MKYLYVHCGNVREFKKTEKIYQDYECVLIEDGITLRARQPGKIICTGTYKQKWNHQEIMESIELHQNVWQVDISFYGNTETLRDDESDLTYGV